MKLLLGETRDNVWQCELPDILPYRRIWITGRLDGQAHVNVDVGQDGHPWYEQLPLTRVTKFPPE